MNSSLSIEQYNRTENEDIAEKFVDVCEGDLAVFKYTFKDLGDENVADSGFSRSVYFQLDNTLDSFEFVDQELLDARAVYKLSCFCGIEDTNPIYLESGTISGEKLEDGSWNIAIDVKVNEDENVTGKGTFFEEDDLFSCVNVETKTCLLYTSPSPRDKRQSRMPSSA